MSNSLKKAVGLNKNTNEQMSPTEANSSLKERDLEEVKFIQGMKYGRNIVWCRHWGGHNFTL